MPGSTDGETCCDPDDPMLKTICWEGCKCCPDGTYSGSIGDGKTFTCGGVTLIAGQDDDKFGKVCQDDKMTSTIDNCICYLIYAPLCCGGEEYGNDCFAKCAGHDIDNDCIVKKTNDITCNQSAVEMLNIAYCLVVVANILVFLF